jgi:hypothetical protein
MTLYYSTIDWQGSVPVPERKVNGGLYTGQPAQGPWGNVPVIPEAHVYHTQNLQSAKPPPGATHQPVSFDRPGNSATLHPFHQSVPSMQEKFIGP